MWHNERNRMKRGAWSGKSRIEMGIKSMAWRVSSRDATRLARRVLPLPVMWPESIPIKHTITIIVYCYNQVCRVISLKTLSVFILCNISTNLKANSTLWNKVLSVKHYDKTNYVYNYWTMWYTFSNSEVGWKFNFFS